MSSVIRHLLSADLPYAPGHVASVSTGSALGKALQLLAAALVVGARDRTTTAVVHIHTSQGFDLLRALGLATVARSRGLPVVLTIHGSSFPRSARSHRRIARRLVRSASVVTCLSQETAGIVSDLGAESVQIIPNPVALPARRRGGAEPVVLFAGEIGPRKGVDLLLSAWSRLGPTTEPYTLLLMGPLAAPELVDTLPARARYLGCLSPEDGAEVMARSSLVVLPSRAEALPMVLLEAMAQGVPFIATDVGGVRRLEEGGILIAPDDRAGLESALASLLSDAGLRESLGEKGRALVERDFSRESVASRLQGIYEGLSDD